MTAHRADDELAGAGGSWARHDEVDHPQVRAQAYPDSCGPACGALTFLLRSLLEDYLEEDLYNSVGRQPASVELLAYAMNDVAPPGETSKWIGIAVGGVDNEQQLKRFLAQHTPWIAHFREEENLKAPGHFVIVNAISDDHIQILDPWKPGTAYHMKFDSFLRYWNLQLVAPQGIL